MYDFIYNLLSSDIGLYYFYVVPIMQKVVYSFEQSPTELILHISYELQKGCFCQKNFHHAIASSTRGFWLLLLDDMHVQKSYIAEGTYI